MSVVWKGRHRRTHYWGRDDVYIIITVDEAREGGREGRREGRREEDG